MARKALRVVSAGEKPAPARKLSVAQAATGGSHRDLLVAMRDRIAVTVSDPDCPPRDLAALTRRLQDIAKEIDAIDQRATDEGEVDDGEVDTTFDASAL